MIPTKYNYLYTFNKILLVYALADCHLLTINIMEIFPADYSAARCYKKKKKKKHIHYTLLKCRGPNPLCIPSPSPFLPLPPPLSLSLSLSHPMPTSCGHCFTVATHHLHLHVVIVSNGLFSLSGSNQEKTAWSSRKVIVLGLTTSL